MSNIRVGVIVAAIVVTSQASGHHSDAGFNDEAVVVLQGAITGFNWKNPHVYINVEAMDDRGELVEWVVESGSTVILARSGWTEDSLMPEDRVTVRANPARDGRPHALLLSLEKTDGSVLEQKESSEPPTGRASSLSGVWKGSPWPEDFMERWIAKPVTEKALDAQAQFDINSENPSENCIADSSPALLMAYNFLIEIELREDVVLIRSERYDVERTVFMDGRGHPENGQRTNQGHSIGWWEGDTLVVDTTHFSDHRNAYAVGGLPSGAQKHVTERYTLSEDGTRFMVDVLLEDSEYLAEPFTVTFEFNYRSDLEFLRYDCDPEVARRYISE